MATVKQGAFLVRSHLYITTIRALGKPVLAINPSVALAILGYLLS